MLKYSNRSFYENRLYHLGFNYFQKIGPMRLKRIEELFPSLADAWRADSQELIEAGLNPKISEEFVVWRKTFNLNGIPDILEKKQIHYCTWSETDYPEMLKEISAPPPILYYRGNLADPHDRKRLSVVGSRRPTAYAEKISATLLSIVATAGIEIVSGLALGVDTLAHCAALKAQGRTLAVLGSGLNDNCLYPRANRRLAADIVSSGGAIISEFPPDMPPYKQNFPQRNRIISGLSSCTLVVEARGKSGALITANYALEQNRDVLAIPGNIFSDLSTGPNQLIKAGARVITGVEDILENFQIRLEKKTIGAGENNNHRPNNKVEAIVYDLIKRAAARAEVITADEIIKKTELDTATINSTLSILEISGLAKNTGSGYALN